jgi:hypothetical protein
MDPQAFPDVFAAFVRDLRPEASPPLLAMDGKAARGRHDGRAQTLPLVRALASAARRVLAQPATAQKSNEMTALRERRTWLDRRGATVSLEALGCQREIAPARVAGGGPSRLGLQGQPGALPEEVR